MPETTAFHATVCESHIAAGIKLALIEAAEKLAKDYAEKFRQDLLREVAKLSVQVMETIQANHLGDHVQFVINFPIGEEK